MSKAKSARGEIVDFDLLKIKAQMASAPTTTEVAARQDFIDQKFKRKVKRIAQQVSTMKEIAVQPTVPSVDPLPKTDTNVEEFNDSEEI